MCKKCLALLMILLLLPLTATAQEVVRAPFYGYFRDEELHWLRSEPKAGSATLDNIPKLILLYMEPVDDKYAKTTYKGKEGYVYYKGCEIMDYSDPWAEDAVQLEGFFGAPVYMRQSPLKNAPLVALLPTDVRFRIRPVTEEYAHIVYEGREGYVYIADFVEMEYRKGSTDPYVAFVDQETPAYDSPCYGASVGALLQPYTPVTVDGYDGDHVTILYEGQRLYADGSELTRLNDDYVLEPFEAMVASRAEVKQYPLENATVIGEIPKDTAVTLEALYGEYARVSSPAISGYISFRRLKSSASVDAAVDMMGKLQERLESQRILNIAFSMLEENNPILLAYNRDFGGSAVACFQYGCPYLWAGFNESSLLRARHPSSDSNYYFTDKLYLGGFDCIGFTRWVHAQAGMKRLPAISESQSAPASRRVDAVKKLPYDQWQTVLKVGDALNMHYRSGGYHTGLYIGTLRDYGYDESVLGDLAPYTDYPLLIHCGMNNFHTAWYTQYLADNRLTSVTPPDGGVTISILGIPYDKAPYTETMWKGTRNVKTFYWFDLDGYNLTVITPTDESYSWFNVYRNTEK
ncbi:MAG: C40 family peptidase [Clostridia bacterium]|nr:C40 family peptidase [Clostridia bacterium]